jgi:hypothetical protein
MGEAAWHFLSHVNPGKSMRIDIRLHRASRVSGLSTAVSVSVQNVGQVARSRWNLQKKRDTMKVVPR